jgi:hypothetical protein
VPLVRPVTVIGEAAPEAVMPPGLEVTVYDVIALPPSETGAVNDTVASVLPATADGEVGAPGTEAGVTALDESEAVPVPTLLVAVTVNL